MRNGKGIFVNEYGEKYEGNWENDLKNKNGIYFYKNRDVFNGEFKDDKIIHGKKTFHDGTIYEGNFQDDLFNGEGEFLYPNGDKYIGNFKQNLMNGQGKLFFKKEHFVIIYSKKVKLFITTDFLKENLKIILKKKEFFTTTTEINTMANSKTTFQTEKENILT